MIDKIHITVYTISTKENNRYVFIYFVITREKSMCQFKHYNLQISKDFSFKSNKLHIDLHLTSHLFQRRKNEEKIRSFMFSAQWQYEDIINSMIIDYNILEYGSAKVVFIFKHQKETYGMLVDQRVRENVCDITIITIDKIGERHFKESDIFFKENNKLYSDYVLQNSFIKQVSKRVVSQSNFQFYETYFFEKIKKNAGYSDLDEPKFFNSIKSRVESGSLDYSNFWISTNVGKTKMPIYLRISIERIKKRNVIILIDIKRDEEKAMKLCSENEEKICEFSQWEGGDYGVKIIQVPFPISGLKIKNKRKFNEQTR